jgi:7-keto-8-aminopelargonate synthetase-like enzyme
VTAAPYLYSGPSPTASLATVLSGLEVNRTSGDLIRRDLYRKTTRVLKRISELGLVTLNRSGFPIAELPIGREDDIGEVGRFLFENGIYVTLAPYPLVPKNQVGFRVQVTAANDDDEIEQLCDVLGELSLRFGMGRDSSA